MSCLNSSSAFSIFFCGSAKSFAAASPAAPPGVSTWRLTSTPVESPCGSKRTAPPVSTWLLLSSSDFHAILRSVSSSMILASHSTVLPSGPSTTQCVTSAEPSLGSTDFTSSMICGRLVSGRHHW